MSDQSRDHAALRRKVEKRVARQKWNYRITFFVMHLIFYLTAMLMIWGIVLTSPAVGDALFNSATAAPTIVLLPTILWGVVVFFHAAALYLETSAAEKSIRQRLLMRELGEELLRESLAADELPEKPKRQATAQEVGYSRLTDDGELIRADEDDALYEPQPRANQSL